MKQKAYCRDFDRLTNAEADLGTAIRTIPAPLDGPAIDPAPITDPGEERTVEGPPGVEHLGYALLHDGELYPVLTPYDAWTPHYTCLYAVFALIVDESMPFAGERLNSVYDENEQAGRGHRIDWETTKIMVRWKEALTEIARLRTGLIALAEWAANVPLEGVDNSLTRSALVEVAKRLTELDSAFAETLKKWREH